MSFVKSWTRRLFFLFKGTVGETLSITTTNFIELNVKKGQQHYIREYQSDIAIGAQKYYLVRFGPDPCIIKVRQLATNSDNVFYRVYYNADISDDGTSIPIENFNEVYQVPPQATAFEDPTIVSTGQFEIERWLPGAVDVGNRSQGEYQVDGLERVIQGSRVALIEIDNQGSEPVSVEYLLAWYEGPIVPLGNEEVIPT